MQWWLSNVEHIYHETYQPILSSHRNVMNMHHTPSIKPIKNTIMSRLILNVTLKVSPSLHLFDLGRDQKMYIN